MTLYLVRHGRAASSVEEADPPLDATGQRQAECTALALASRGISRLVVSPLRRTRETAAPIAARLALEPEIRAEVAEVFEPTMNAEERVAMLGPFLSGRWSEQPPRLQGFRDGVVRTLFELGSHGAPVLVVSHFVAISVAVGAALGDDRVVPHPIPNASITILDVVSGALVLRAVGDATHLAPDLQTIAAPTLQPDTQRNSG